MTQKYVCAFSHVLSRKVLNRFPTAAGSVIAIVPDWVDLNQLANI